VARDIPHVVGAAGIAAFGAASTALAMTTPEASTATLISVGTVAVLMTVGLAAVQYRVTTRAWSAVITAALVGVLAGAWIRVFNAWPVEQQSGYLSDSVVILSMGLGWLTLAPVVSALGARPGTAQVPAPGLGQGKRVTLALACSALGLAVPWGAFALAEYVGWGSANRWAPVVVCALLGAVIVASAGAAGVILAQRAVTPAVARGFAVGLVLAALFGVAYGPFVLVASALRGTDMRVDMLASGLMATVGACASMVATGAFARVSRRLPPSQPSHLGFARDHNR